MRILFQFPDYDFSISHATYTDMNHFILENKLCRAIIEENNL